MKSLRLLSFSPAFVGLSCALACSAASSGGTDSPGTGAGTGGSSDGSTGGAPTGGTGGSAAGTGGADAGSGGASPGTGGTANGGDVCSGATGTAPSGALSATQVAAANPTDFDFHLLEGPVWIGDALYYSDFTTSGGFPSVIKKYTPGGSAEIFIDDSGSNGLAVNASGNLVAATHDRKELSLYDLTTKARTTIIGEYDGNPFNSPNDLAIGPGGDIYFTDPDFQKSAAPGGQTQTRVYHWDGSAVTVVDDSFQNPNGVAVSPDGSHLFVSGGGGSGKVRKYPLTDGVPGAGTDIADISEPDGMTFDCLGNLYATEHSNSQVRVMTQDGAEIATISIGPATTMNGSQDSNATNVAFGGADGTTLFITGTYALWEVGLDVTGLPY